MRDGDNLRIIVIKPGGNPRDPAHFMIADICDAFCDLGHQVEVIDLQTPVLLGDIIDQFNRFSPDFVFTLNFEGYSSHLRSIMEKMKLSYTSWVIDRVHSFEFLRGYDSFYYTIFVIEKEDIDELKNLRFGQVHLLPSATNPKIFKKMELPKEDLAKYSSEISFIGNSYLHLVDYYERYLDSIRNLQARRMIEELVKRQAQNIKMNISTILEAIEEESGYSFVFKDEVHREAILNKLSSAAQGIYRRELVKEVCGLGLSLYGDGGWGELKEMGADYGGWIDNRTDLPKLYNASKINLNICLGKTAPNLRFFEVLACGGFLLTNYLDDIEKLFELDKEIVCYRDAKELREKAKYYLAHPKERKEIARRGQERVLREHTYKNRMKEMIDILKGIKMAGRDKKLVDKQDRYV